MGGALFELGVEAYEDVVSPPAKTVAKREIDAKDHYHDQAAIRTDGLLMFLMLWETTKQDKSGVRKTITQATRVMHH